MLSAPRTRQVQRARSHAERLASRDGYFSPESVIRRIGNTPVTPFLGGGTAVLLQVAHPLVAAGVACHSDYRGDLWRRLGRTLQALYLITFGTKAEAERAAAAVQAVHASIRGAIPAALGPFPAGTPYAADDPELMLWVHATLVTASLSAYRRFERSLSAGEEDEYYRQMATVAELFGVPAAIVPASLTEFRSYFANQLASAAISVTAPAREIAAVVLRAPLPAPMRLLSPAHRLATAAQLPAQLRDEYGLRWTRAQALALPFAARSLRLTSWPILQAAGRLRPPVPITV